MSGSRTHEGSEIQNAIREVLWRDWAPIPPPVPADEYDAYIGRIYRLLLSRPQRQVVADVLSNIERNEIGLGRGNEETLLSVADRLLSLNIHLAS
jgi:hypothetical protein